jgi:hypothetical protein
MAPIAAPNAEPPPIATTFRLLCDGPVWPERFVESVYDFPFTSTEVSLSHNFAGVFRRPEGCTLATFSVALEPFGMAVLPLTTTFEATVPVSFSPTFALLELTD